MNLYIIGYFTGRIITYFVILSSGIILISAIIKSHKTI